VTKAQLLRDPSTGKDRSVEYASSYTKQVSDNLDKTAAVLSLVESAYTKDTGKKFSFSSGWRPEAVNAATAGAAKASKHTLGFAADIIDPDNHVWEWFKANLALCKKLGVYLEDPRWCKSAKGNMWVHAQIVPPASKKRVFIPYADQVKNPMTAPDRWDGKYESSLDGDPT